jgi:hypothetical protein
VDGGDSVCISPRASIINPRESNQIIAAAINFPIDLNAKRFAKEEEPRILFALSLERNARKGQNAQMYIALPALAQ